LSARAPFKLWTRALWLFWIMRVPW
jgi:hypothetical protein